MFIQIYPNPDFFQDDGSDTNDHLVFWLEVTEDQYSYLQHTHSNWLAISVLPEDWEDDTVDVHFQNMSLLIFANFIFGVRQQYNHEMELLPG